MRKKKTKEWKRKKRKSKKEKENDRVRKREGRTFYAGSTKIEENKTINLCINIELKIAINFHPRHMQINKHVKSVPQSHLLCFGWHNFHLPIINAFKINHNARLDSPFVPHTYIWHSSNKSCSISVTAYYMPWQHLFSFTKRCRCVATPQKYNNQPTKQPTNESELPQPLKTNRFAPFTQFHIYSYGCFDALKIIWMIELVVLKPHRFKHKNAFHMHIPHTISTITMQRITNTADARGLFAKAKTTFRP